MYRKITKLFLLLLIPSLLTAKALGPDVSQYRGEELKWEDGAYGYHVMFKTLLENLEAETSGNPQADTCIAESMGSTYSLDISHVPADAYVERAFLIWSGAVPVANVNGPTDNEVTLSYVSADGQISETQVIKGKKAYTTSESADFEFDGFKDLDDPTHSFFTYRVDVTDYFKSIHDKGRELGLEDGYSLYGDYTVSDLTCASDSSYKTTTDMVSGWSLVMIYTSIEISPKKIYFYDGFKAYWFEESEINVTGFEFPTEPEVRLTLITHEGDPNLVSLQNSDGGNADPEGLQVQGDQVGWLLISNECNPEAQTTDGITTLFYTEVYNSISSVYGWADVNPTCIGGTPPVWDYENIEYAMDVDTFVMDSSTDGSYASHFHKGGERIGLKIGANKDQVITNMLVVSVDTKAPMFDIPGRPEKVACTPANADGKWCENGEHTFAIRIQNWGDDITPPVFVKDTIPEGMEYVPGSTEYATEFTVEDGERIAKKWTKIPDQGESEFPLASGFKVADTIDFCEVGDDYLSCADLIVVRFRAKVSSGTDKKAVLENVAMIDTTGFPTYKTNLGLPVKLTLEPSSCVTDATKIDLSLCGGVGVGGCETNDDCGKYEICDPEEKVCIDDPDIKECKDSVVKAEIGKNSPVSETIYITPQEGLVMGQIALAEETGSDCYYSLTQVVLKVDVDDTNIQLSNFKLVHDANGNGYYDPDAEVGEDEYPDSIISSVDSISNGSVSFSIAASSARFFANKVNNLLFIVDASYKEGESVSRNATFFPSVESEGMLISDGGSTKLDGLPLEFSEFQFEPENSFIVTKGMKDPAVPEKKDMNGTHDILQLKVTSKTSEDKITSLKVKLGKSDMASFGSGLKNVSIWEDTDNDGVGDTQIIKASETDSAQMHNFKNLSFAVQADQPKYLTIRADLSLKDKEYFQLEVATVGIDSDRDVLGTPVNSKEYRYVCDPLYEDCNPDSGCSCTMVSAEENPEGLSWLIFSVLIAFSAFFIEKSRRRSN